MPLLAPLLFATSTAASPPHLSAVRVARAIVLDGVLDDDAWRSAPASDVFTQKSPREGSKPSGRTTVRVVYDDDALYVAVDCEQRDVPVVARLTRRDREVEADWVSVSLDSRRDGKSAFVFEINAGGALFDGVRFNDTDFSTDWDENWEARAHVGPHGWSAEFRIPLRILRFQSLPEQSWGFEVRRYISEKQEVDEWALISRSMGGEVSHYGKLDHLLGLSSRSAFELRPFVLGRVRRLDASTLSVPGVPGSVTQARPGGTDVSGSAGVDLKWHPTQDLTLDATLNPDFAQVEADQYVLNLTTFETYYPEKRPFFLEGIDTFATPMQLLYTRRIGRAPPLPTLRTGTKFNEQLLDVPQPATLWGASKLTGRVADGWSIGTLQAVAAPNPVPVRLADGTTAPRVTDPLTSFDVVRVRRDIGDKSYIGLTTTATTRAEQSGDYPIVPGAAGSAATQLCPSGTLLRPGARCTNDAYVAALDWRWRSANGDWASNGQVLASTLKNGPPRSVADGTVINSGDVGKGIVAYVGKEGGTHWVGDVYGGYVDRKLDVNDLGYNPRANNFGGGLDLEYRELEPSGASLESHQRVELGQQYNTAGRLIGHSYQPMTFGRLANFWRYYASVYARPARFDDREMGDGASLERAGRFGADASFVTDTTKLVAINLWVQMQYLSNGFNGAAQGGITLRALPSLDLDVLPNASYTFGEPRYVTTGALATQYLFGHLTATSLGATLRATYTFTPRLTLQTYAQLFLAAGHYAGFVFYQSDPNAPRPDVHLADLRPAQAPSSNPDFEQGALNVNVVLRWEYRLGSLLYVVYTRSQVPSVTLNPGELGAIDLGAVKRAPAADVFVVKLSYWWG